MRKGNNKEGLFATLWVEGSIINVRSSYCKGFVEELKSTIPYSHRKWLMDEKLWQIDPSFTEKLYNLLESYGYKISTIEPNVSTAMVPSNGEDPYRNLLCGLSNETIKKVYRIAIFEAHPDQGGNIKLSQQINEAWNRIKHDRDMK